jgi:type IV pilus assembly protein PilN
MIRINLLPEAKRQVATGGSSQLWAVVYLLACFAWSVVLFLVYLNRSSVLEEQNAKNEELQAQINRVKAQSENIGEIEGRLAKSKQLEEVVAGLQAARQGPARMLMELSKILSEGGGPTLPPEQAEGARRDNPALGYSPGWDIRRLWIDSFKETNRKCAISGFGKSNEDVAEFLRRLNLSELFDKVTLQSTSAQTEQATGLPVVKFQLTCEVKY